MSLDYGWIAQLVEHETENLGVPGSIPGPATIYGELAKWSNAADCKSVPSGSIVRIYDSPPLKIWECGGIGRHPGLKILCPLKGVRVQVSPLPPDAEIPKWLKGLVLKTSRSGIPAPGFESQSPRHFVLVAQLDRAIAF